MSGCCFEMRPKGVPQDCDAFQSAWLTGCKCSAPFSIRDKRPTLSELPVEKLAGDLTLQPGETRLVRKLFQSAWWCWLNECQRQATE